MKLLISKDWLRRKIAANRDIDIEAGRPLHPRNMEKMTVEQARELAKKARDWISTAEGQKQLREAAARAEETTKKLEEDRRVDPQKLSEPFTV